MTTTLNPRAGDRRSRYDRRTLTLKPTSSSGDYASSAPIADQRWGRVSERVAQLAWPRVKPGTVHNWLHSTSQMRLADRLALVIRVCGELDAHHLLAEVMAPVRRAEAMLPALPTREILHEVHEAHALVGVVTVRYFDRPATAVEALLSALAWSAQCAMSAQRALQLEVDRA